MTDVVCYQASDVGMGNRQSGSGTGDEDDDRGQSRHPPRELSIPGGINLAEDFTVEEPPQEQDPGISCDSQSPEVHLVNLTLNTTSNVSLGLCFRLHLRYCSSMSAHPQLACYN